MIPRAPNKKNLNARNQTGREENILHLDKLVYSLRSSQGQGESSSFHSRQK